MTTYRTIDYDAAACLGCGACARACPSEAIEALAPEVGVTAADADTPAASHAENGATVAAPRGVVVSADRPLVLLCECAGTMANIDFDALEERLTPASRHAARHTLVLP